MKGGQIVAWRAARYPLDHRRPAKDLDLRAQAADMAQILVRVRVIANDVAVPDLVPHEGLVSSACCPTTKIVAGTCSRRRIAKTWYVQRGSGPSSKVSATTPLARTSWK